MAITKSLTTGGRAIFDRMSNLFKSSPRIQGLAVKGAGLISPDGPDKSTTSNALVDIFKVKGLSLLRDQLSNGSKAGFIQSLLSNDTNKSGFLMKSALVVAPVLAVAITVLTKLTSALKEASARIHNQTPLGDLIKSGETPTATTQPGQANEKISNPTELAGTGTDLTSLLQINSAPVTQPNSNVDAAFEDWARREKTSRAEFGHTERQLREKQNIVYMLETDQRNDPGNAEIERRLTDAKQNAERALELHSDSMDKRHAIVEQGKMFGHQADTLMANEPVPEDWNRPKDFIPDNWDQPAGPSR